jgi:hypothetical protein
MTDYSIRMQCQGQTDNGNQCTRRGRWHPGEDGWFCWQHTAWGIVSKPDGRGIAVYPPTMGYF